MIVYMIRKENINVLKDVFVFTNKDVVSIQLELCRILYYRFCKISSIYKWKYLNRIKFKILIYGEL